MSRVRQYQSNRQTAAAYHQEGSGCLSFYMLPPLSVLFIGILIPFARDPFPCSSDKLGNKQFFLASNRFAPLFTPEVQHWNASPSFIGAVS